MGNLVCGYRDIYPFCHVVNTHKHNLKATVVFLFYSTSTRVNGNWIFIKKFQVMKMSENCNFKYILTVKKFAILILDFQILDI